MNASDIFRFCFHQHVIARCRSHDESNGTRQFQSHLYSCHVGKRDKIVSWALPADWHCRHLSATSVVRGDEEKTHGHPSPEEVYARAKKKVPAISLATVYKNIHLFVESGVFREVSLHHGSVRVEMNREPHHHMVCLKCKGITDIGEKKLGLVLTKSRLPTGFLVERYAVDAIGVCANCQKARFIVR